MSFQERICRVKRTGTKNRFPGVGKEKLMKTRIEAEKFWDPQNLQARS